ncbi:helix-turn-helix domain-containing protein [Enterococcus sp. BWB1-3]|uniref:helix-turn-helix domain-containing protein n=1 Tax=Enterococcus sp. BWB1-3 TaxID=2787713 RepID=UPI001F2EEADF|nr:helix-turn-helix domain-containing protein [Enterococcus sp. BWB1-3]
MRKTYDREFKLKVSQDIFENNDTVKTVSEEYTISRPTVSRWVSEYRRYGVEMVVSIYPLILT